MSIAALIDSVWTIVVMVLFIGIVLWAYSKRRKGDFEEASRLPLDDELTPTQPTTHPSSEK